MNNVLLIDDSEIDNLVNRKVLERSGLVTSIAIRNSAVSGIEYLNDLPQNSPIFPDLIFLDIRMPEIDGFGFLELFAKLPRFIHQKCKIVMLSSSIDSDDHKKAIESPYVIHFINKPLSKEAVNDLVDM